MTSDQPHPRILVHSIDIPIRWGDMDAMGHLNNTLYFRLMEECRVQWFQAIRTQLKPGVREGAVIVNASCEFLKPITYPATVTVKMFLGKLGSKSIGTTHTMEVDGTLYAQGAAKIVWIDTHTGKAIALPDLVTSLYDQ